MVHVIAVLGLAAACMVWFLVQHWARPEGDAPCDGEDSQCGVCEAHGPDCSVVNLPRPPSDSSRTTRASR